jgi:predicted nucleic acid-binding protein
MNRPSNRGKSISALALPGDKADQALSLVLSGQVTAVLSKPMLEEILGVLARKFSREFLQFDESGHILL